MATYECDALNVGSTAGSLRRSTLEAVGLDVGVVIGRVTATTYTASGLLYSLPAEPEAMAGGKYNI